MAVNACNLRAASRARMVLAFSSAGLAARTRVDRRASSDLRRKLSERERLILKLIASGHTNQTIADQLNISRKTGETHRMRVMQKLDIHKATDLVRFSLTAGILDTL